MRALLVFISILAIAPAVSATVVLPAEFREIVAGSQIIVHGRITEIRPEWTDGRRRIESVITVEAGSFLRGTFAPTVSFRVPGGRIGEFRSVTVGAPEFSPGEEVVLFLRATGPAMPQVFGLHQGVFRVRVDPATGARLVATPVVAARTLLPTRVVRGATERRPMALDQFAATVRSVLQQAGAR